jgi:L-glutamine-phosphate cytidylyltransferase
MKAVIMAAGRGSRLGALTLARPKCLLPLASESVLRRQLRLLGEVGIQDVVLVVGYRCADIAAHVAGLQGVTLALNPLHEGTGSISSVVAAREHYAGDVLFLNSDLVYERRMLEGLASAPRDAALAVSRMRARSPHVPVLLEADRVTDIGRHIPASMADASFCCAGLVRNSAWPAFSRALERTAASGLIGGWSRVYARLAAEGSDVGAVDSEGPWWDINSVRVYTAARHWTEA